MTVSQVMGCGAQHGYTEIVHGMEEAKEKAKEKGKRKIKKSLQNKSPYGIIKNGHCESGGRKI